MVGGRSANGATDVPRIGAAGEQRLAGEMGVWACLEWHDRSSEGKSLPFFGKGEDIKSLLLSVPHLKATKAEIICQTCKMKHCTLDKMVYLFVYL